MDGQSRSSPDIGADEYSTGSISRTPLATSDVGPASGGGIGGGGGGGIDTSAIYEIQNEASSLVLNQQGKLTNGSAITQWSSGSSDNLKWKFISTSGGSSGDDQWLPQQNSDGSYTFVNLHSGKVLEDPGSSTSTSTQMDQWDANSGSNQKWNLLKQ
jgi:endo-1,4-beta-xylanase